MDKLEMAVTSDRTVLNFSERDVYCEEKQK